MTLATKAELRTDVGNWLNRATDADFLARFDSFLALAEDDIGKKLRSKVNERRLTATLNERWENNPTGSRQVRSISILNNGDYQDGGPLTYLTYQRAVARYGEGAGASDLVRAYTLVGEQIGFFPFPSEDLTSTLQFEIVAYVRPDPLLLDADNNEVLTTYPSVYLWGTLLQTADYYGRGGDKVKWGESYLAAIDDANVEADDLPGDSLIQVAC
ncbi:MAG: phage adaptor protein [Geminicoccaceae bacterium]